MGLTLIAFEFLHVLPRELGGLDPPFTEFDAQREFNSIEAASILLIDMVLDSPLEAGTGRVLAETVLGTYTSKPPQNLSSITYHSMLWHPRRPSKEYISFPRSPEVDWWKAAEKQLLTMLYQQDQLISITGLGEGCVHRWSQIFCVAFFSLVQKLLKKLRSRDTKRRDRNFLVPLLIIVAKVSTKATFIGKWWLTIFLDVHQQLLTNLEIRRKVNKQVLLDIMISLAFKIFTKMLAKSQFVSILNWCTQAQTHLNIYCNYWLKKLTLENDPPDAFNDLAGFHIFADHLKRLTLDNFAGLESSSRSLVEHGRHFGHVCQSISRIGFFCEGDMSIFHDLLSGDTKIRYEDFPENASISDAILPGNPMKGLDRAELVAKQFFDVLTKDSRFKTRTLSRKEKLDITERLKSYEIWFL